MAGRVCQSLEMHFGFGSGFESMFAHRVLLTNTALNAAHAQRDLLGSAWGFGALGISFHIALISYAWVGLGALCDTWYLLSPSRRHESPTLKLGRFSGLTFRFFVSRLLICHQLSDFINNLDRLYGVGVLRGESRIISNVIIKFIKFIPEKPRRQHGRLSRQTEIMSADEP